MKLTNTQCEEVQNAILFLDQKALLKPALAYKLAKVLSAVEPHTKALQSAREAILKKYKKTSMSQNDPEYLEAMEELSPIAEDLVEVSIQKIPEKDILSAEGHMSANVVRHLLPILQMEE